MQWIKNNQELLKNSILVLLVVVIGFILITNFNKDKTPEVENILVSPMSVFSKGEFEYSFDAVKWLFDTGTKDSTKVSFTFENFSRRSDKTPATFAIPFFVKFTPGTCSQVSELPVSVGSPFFGDETCSSGPLVAVAQCGEIVDPTWITIHQCGERLVVSEKNSQKWEKVRTLNLTKIVD